MNKIWFKRKTYGWGWTPCTWEGWFVVIIWGILFVSFVSKMNENEWLKNFLFISITTGILIYISYKKGESPRWQWGDKNDKKLK